MMIRTLSRHSKWAQGRTLFARFARASFNHSTLAPPPSERRLEGKVAIVTGGASGIGAAIVRTFITHGARVVVADIQEDQSLSTELGDNGHYVHCDVSQESHVAAAVDLAISKFGSLDIMFNNAGVVSGRRPTSSFSELDMSEFEQVFNINVKGVAHGVKHAARVMIPSTSGTIISTASVVHLMAGLALHPYTISKHAIVGITKSAACELAHYGIRVNCISPGGVKTNASVEFGKLLGSKTEELIPGKPLADPHEIAQTALFLASDDSKLITGHDLVVDEGFTLSIPLNIFKAMQTGLLQLQMS